MSDRIKLRTFISFDTNADPEHYPVKGAWNIARFDEDQLRDDPHLLSEVLVNREYTVRSVPVDALEVELQFDEEIAQVLIEAETGFEFLPGELQNTNAEEFLRLARTFFDLGKHACCVEMFDRGWCAAAKLADRDDLPADIGSPFYSVELGKALGEWS